MAEARKIYMEVHERNPFGEDFNEELLKTPEKSSNFIRGYSDVRHDNELRALRGEPIVPLKHRFQFVKAKNHVSGADSGTGVQQALDKHYKIADYDECVELGYAVDENENFVRTVDGRVQWGDCILTIAEAEVAATHWKAQRDAVEEQSDEVTAKMDAAVERFNRSDVASKGKMRASHFQFVGDDPEEK
jgi:hypothetical protein